MVKDKVNVITFSLSYIELCTAIEVLKENGKKIGKLQAMFISPSDFSADISILFALNVFREMEIQRKKKTSK